MTTVKVKDLKENQEYKLRSSQRKWRICKKLYWLKKENTHAETYEKHLKGKDHILIIGPSCGQTQMLPDDEVIINENQKF